MGDITAALDAWREGSSSATERLIGLIYPHLRRIAQRRLSGESSSASLQTSDLAQETLIRLVLRRRVPFRNRRQLFAIAARLARCVLVDRARQRGASKRTDPGGRWHADPVSASRPDLHPDILALNAALDDLSQLDPQAVRVVEMRYFAGLSLEETAAEMGIGRSSVVRTWRCARAWLERRLTEGAS